MKRTATLVGRTVVLAIALAGVLASPFGAPALTASASQCTLSPNTQSGISCGDPSGSGTIFTPSSGTPTGSTQTPCRYSAQEGDLPSTFWDYTSRPYAEVSYPDETGINTVRVFHDKDEIIGVVRTHTNPTTHAYSVVASNMSVPEVLQEAAFDCILSANGWSWRVADDPRDSVAAPTTPPADESSLLSFSTVMVPLPARPNEYLLRVNLTNSNTLTATASVEFSRSTWSAVTKVSGPADVTCGAQEGVEFCQAPNVAPGTTESLVFDVTTTDAAAPLPIDVISDGYLKMKLADARPAGLVAGPVMTRILVARP